MNALKISPLLLSVMMAAGWGWNRPAVGSEAAQRAQTILEKTGVKGGVVVHVGCGEGGLTVAFRVNDRFLVQGLATDADEVEEARKYVDSRNCHGPILVRKYDGKNLPYGDNIVNLLVIEKLSSLSGAEIERVLVPGGVAVVNADMQLIGTSELAHGGEFGQWREYYKPWPEDIDEWTHYLYDASGNAVSKGTKGGAPRHLQWYAGPKHSRHHDALASLSAMTSSGGRVFYILDEGDTSLIHRPAKWKLIARDAFNGKLLWKRHIPAWFTHLYNFRAGPKQLPRRLVSVDDHVYATLGWTAPISKLDAATGKTLAVYPDSKGAEELIYHEGVLLAVLNEPEILLERADGCHGYWELAEDEEPPVGKSIVAYDAESGDMRWRQNGDNLKYLSPLSLSAHEKKVFYHDGKNLQCASLADGSQCWAAPFETDGWFIRSYAPTIAAHKDVVMCLKWDRICGYSINNGEKLWENKGSIGYGSPGDLFAIGDTVWTFPMRVGIKTPHGKLLNSGKTAVGLDVHTGKIKHTPSTWRPGHHDRCYRDKATESHIYLGYRGVEVFDPATGGYEANDWVRGLCQYGIMPANGYLYTPPDPCMCYQIVQFDFLSAFSASNTLADATLEPSVTKGPFFPHVAARKADTNSILKNASTSCPGWCPPATYGRKDEWPTYRGNISRSGSTNSRLPRQLSTKWKAEIGGSLTAPVIADQKVFLASKDECALYALDAETGKRKWKFLTNGRVDSPPTIYKGLAVFGCNDGSVYCLDADSGQLAWRFKVSEMERQIGSASRLESPFPVSGSVLVQENTVYFAAGHSSFLDGGIHLYGLDIWTGKKRYHRKLASGYWGDGKHVGSLPDILISDGTNINMRHVQFDKTLRVHDNFNIKTLLSMKGLLDSSWFYRINWVLGYDFKGQTDVPLSRNAVGRVRTESKRGRQNAHPGEIARISNTGQLIVYDRDHFYSVKTGYSRLMYERRRSRRKYNQIGGPHQKFARYTAEDWFPVGSIIFGYAAVEEKEKFGIAEMWSTTEDFQPRAMILGAENLYLAGWLDAVAVKLKSGRPKNPSDSDQHRPVLRLYCAANGKRIWECKLQSDPVFDGMAAAYGDLFIALENGKLVCMGSN